MVKNIPPTTLSVFSDDYQSAREQFLNAAKAASATTESYIHPSAQGPDGETLSIDTAWIGPRDASSVMIMICGTHGPESFTGAAIQLDWLQSGAYLPSSSMSMLLIHAANPFGWAHCSRTTEHNVDLNRNFIDHPDKSAETGLTRSIQNILCRSTSRGPRFNHIMLSLGKLLVSTGSAKLQNEISQGQYSYSCGIGFGGHRAEWSNTSIKTILHRNLEHAEHVTIIDWHTGIGQYGEPCFLCFDEITTPEYQRAIKTWGEEIRNSNASYTSGERPEYHGLLINAARDAVKACGAKATTCVIEFGTYSNFKMLKALLIDRWLRFGAHTSRPKRKLKLKEKMLRSFYPTDTQWRANVLRHGEKIIADSLAGLHAQEVKA